MVGYGNIVVGYGNIGYGNTYSRTPKEEEKPKKDKPEKDNSESVIETLCNEAGYTRENLEGTELEAKIDIESRRGLAFKEMPPLWGEIDFPAPYSLDKILGGSEAIHECYGYISGKGIVTEAFTKVRKGGKTKIKIKGKTTYLNEKGIFILRRDEEHKMDMTSQEIMTFIAKEARTHDLPLEYIGSFHKKSEEAFVFNPVSGRIFVLAKNMCTSESRKSLYQLEVEYYGRINGYKKSGDIREEAAFLAQAMIKDVSRLGYTGKTSKLTKFEWMAGNAG